MRKHLFLIGLIGVLVMAAGGVCRAGERRRLTVTPAARPAPSPSGSQLSCPAPPPTWPGVSRSTTVLLHGPGGDGRRGRHGDLPIPRACSTLPMRRPPSVTMPLKAMTSSLPTARSMATPCLKSPPISRRPALPGARRSIPARMTGYENVFAYEANAQEGGYVNGVIAALLNQSGVIGVVGPVEAGDAKLYIDGFVGGVAGDQSRYRRQHFLHRLIWRHGSGGRSRQHPHFRPAQIS